jgi:glucose-6-phosphate isomerase
MSIDRSLAWRALAEHANTLKGKQLADLFAEDSTRFQQFSYETNDFLLDISKQCITNETLKLLTGLAESQQLSQSIEKLFIGEVVNYSEQRPALHTALRQPIETTIMVDGKNIMIDVQKSLTKMKLMVDMIHSSQWRGYNGQPIKDVVNIGVGGSNLGPLTACEALFNQEMQDDHGLRVHFVSSMDGSELSSLLDGLDAASTLFIISSKSFTTADTLANANTAREWLVSASVSPIELINKHHFIAVTANASKALAWGVPEKNQLLFWEWVGGRFSLWSVIGLPIALQIGMDGFQALLEGAHEMDVHFRGASFEKNLPVLLALVSIWNINFLNIHAHAILPYDGRLASLPYYLEQLEMESNGKNVNHAGEHINYKTCPILWGEIGSNAQHAFYQLLHQGTEPVMCDFIAPVNRYQHDIQELKNQHRLSLANCFAQSRLLALGDSMLEDKENAPNHKRYIGSKPSSTLLFSELSPKVLGGLIALYEHKVFVQSVIWEINPFDQWGVELGKKIATSMLPRLSSKEGAPLDGSTNGLLSHVRNKQGDVT